MSEKKSARHTQGLSRRDFLRTAALGAAAASVGPMAISTAARSAGAAPAAGTQTKPTVVDVRSPQWRANGQVDAAVVRKMMDHGMARLTGKKTLADAWRMIAKPNEVVGIKFNGLSRDYTGANQAVLDAIVAGLTAAGVKKENIIVTEGVGTNWKNAIQPKTGGSGDPIDVGAARPVQLSQYITEQVDCIINVPNIKDHGGAGVTGCLKNFSHSRSIAAPPIHNDSCSPAIVGVNKLEPVRTKRRLNIVNGLIAIFNGGPGTGRKEFQWEHNGLLFATDPVACDRVQIEIINAERERRGSPSLYQRGSKPKHVEQAAKAGLGIADLTKINWIKAFKQETQPA